MDKSFNLSVFHFDVGEGCENLADSECFLVPAIRTLRHRSEINKSMRAPIQSAGHKIPASRQEETDGLQLSGERWRSSLTPAGGKERPLETVSAL